MFERFIAKKSKQISKPRLSQRVQLMVENLEQRLVPANTINLTASNGILVITSVDAGGDSVTIQQDSATRYEILGTSVGAPVTTGNTSGGLTFTFTTATDITVDGVTGITANLLGSTGTDTVTLDGDGTGNGSLSGNLILNESSTTADLQLTDTAAFNVSGQFKIATTGTSVIDASLTKADTFGSVLLTGGSGGSTFEATGGITDADFFSFTATGGANEVNLSDAAIGSFVSYVGGSGNDELFLDDTSVATVVGASMGSSNGGDGDILDIYGGSVINGNVTATGSGKETYGFEGSTTEVLGYTSLNSTGTGGTAVSVNGATLDNFLSVVTGGGTNHISIENGATINGPFGFQSAGNLTLRIGGGSGTDTTTITGDIFQTDAGGLTSETVRIGTDTDQGSSGTSDVAEIQGWVSINAASATQGISVTVDGGGAPTAPTIGGAFLSVVGGKGNDSIELLDGANIAGTFGYTLNGGAANVAIAGTNTVVAGNVFQADPGSSATTDTFFLTNGATVGGYVSVNSALATGAVTVVIDGDNVSDPSHSVNTIGGYLSVVSGTGNDLLSINDATIASTVGWVLGAGNDTVQTNNILVQGGFFGDFGTGNDKLLTEDAAGIAVQTFLTAGNDATTTAATQSGNTTVNGPINPASAGGLGFINMGAGNDSAELGGSATNQFVYGFNQPLVITASGGTSTLNTHLSGGISTSLSFTAGTVLQANGFTNLV